MFEDSYKTIAKPAEGSYSEKRSKFLAYAFPVQNEQEVKQRLAEIQKSTGMRDTTAMPTFSVRTRMLTV